MQRHLPRTACSTGEDAMRRLIIAALLTATATAAFADPTPKEQLLVPPADATHFVVVSTAGKHGDDYMWTLPDGRTAFRESILLRGLVFETDETMRYGPTECPPRCRSAASPQAATPPSISCSPATRPAGRARSTRAVPRIRRLLIMRRSAAQTSAPRPRWSACSRSAAPEWRCFPRARPASTRSPRSTSTARKAPGTSTSS